MNERFYEGITLDNRAVRVAVSGGKIVSCSPVEPRGDLPRLLPLLVDLQQNGALGYAFNQLNGYNAREALSAIGEHLLVNGVGRVLATIPTAPYEVLKTAARSIGEVLDADDTLDRLYAGIFHEGVFISPDKGWRGGHKPEYILAPQWEMFSELNSLSGSRVKLVNVAPEVPGALKFIRRAADNKNYGGITMAEMEKSNSFIAMEHEVLKFWEENNCYELRKEKNKDKERFRFIDGPITANNPMSAKVGGTASLLSHTDTSTVEGTAYHAPSTLSPS